MNYSIATLKKMLRNNGIFNSLFMVFIEIWDNIDVRFIV